MNKRHEIHYNQLIINHIQDNKKSIKHLPGTVSDRKAKKMPAVFICRH